MAKDKSLFKEVADIFDGYHPLATFYDGVLYINPYSVKHQNDYEDKIKKLHDLVKTGPACWQLSSVVLGDYPVPKPMQYMGSTELV